MRPKRSDDAGQMFFTHLGVTRKVRVPTRPDPAVLRALALYRRLLQAPAFSPRKAVLSRRTLRWLEGAAPQQAYAYYCGIETIRRQEMP